MEVGDVDRVEFVPDVDSDRGGWGLVGFAAVAGGTFDEGATLPAHRRRNEKVAEAVVDTHDRCYRIRKQLGLLLNEPVGR